MGKIVVNKKKEESWWKNERYEGSVREEKMERGMR